jgi:hypothetical protein
VTSGAPTADLLGLAGIHAWLWSVRN